MNDVSPNTTDTTVDVATAAQRLGISEEAVRARIRRGKLRAEKVGALWRVYLQEGESTTPEPTPRDATQQPVTQRNTTAGPVAQQDTTPLEVGLAPLAETIERLSRHNAELSAAAAMWQIRSMHLEDQLKQLTATAGNADEVPAAPERDETDDQAQSHTSRKLRRHLWASGHV